MHTAELIGMALRDREDCPALPEEPRPGLCAVTGVARMTVARKCLFGKSFTNIDRLAVPESDRVGVAAYWALKYGPERKSCWFCDGQRFLQIRKPDIRLMVLGCPSILAPTWAGYVTTSYQKHGALVAPVNGPVTDLWGFDDSVVDCDVGKSRDWWSRLNQALLAGISRTSIERVDCPVYALKAVGVSTWLEFEAWAKPHSLNPLYRFLCYLLPSQEELKGGFDHAAF